MKEIAVNAIKVIKTFVIWEVCCLRASLLESTV